MIYDCFLFHNELDLLEIRLNVLDDVVDKFVLVEATETFSGVPKPLFYRDNEERFKKWRHKIIHHVVVKYSDEEWAEAKASPNTGGLDHWCREFVQRENLKKPLVDCNNDDIIFLSDLDEIWDPVVISEIKNGVYKIKQTVYTYFLNNKSNEEWAGTVGCKYHWIRDHYSINYLRSAKELPLYMNYTDSHTGQSVTKLHKDNILHFIGNGWHFTSMGGAKALKKKIESYGHQEFNDPVVLDMLEYNINHNRDFIGRGFTYTLDEGQWPTYLKENREKYKHLLK